MTIALYKALVTALLDVLDWVLLSGFLPWKWAAFISACTWFSTSPHVAPAWISHRACRGFLHGNSSLFSFCIGRDGTRDSCIAIHQAQPFPIELVLWLVHWMLGSLSQHMVPISPHGLLASFDTIACVSVTSPVCSILSSWDIMQHSLFGDCA